VPLRSLTKRSSFGRKHIPHGISKPSIKFSTMKDSLSVFSTEVSQPYDSSAFVLHEKRNNNIGMSIKLLIN